VQIIYKKIMLVIALCLLFGISAIYGQLSLSDKADSLKRAGDYTQALTIYTALLKQDIEEDSLKNQTREYNNIANVYCRMGDYDESTKNYFKALRLSEKQNDNKRKAIITYNIGMNYSVMKQDSLSIIYLNKAVTLLKAQKTNDATLANCYNILGSLYGNAKNYSQAFNYLKLAEMYFETSNEPEQLGNVYVNIAYIEIEHGNYTRVNEYARKSLVLFTKVNDPKGVATAYINLNSAHYFLSSNQKGQNYKKAMYKCITFLDSAAAAIKNVDSPEHYIRIYKNKSQLYADLNNGDSAYFYLSKSVAIKDSVYELSTQQQIAELRLQYEIEKKEQMILVLKEQNATATAIAQKNNLWILIACAFALVLLLLLVLIIAINRNRKKQKEIDFIKTKSELEQTALRAQMNPHFIFNALNSIQHYILSKQTEYAYDYLAKFSKLIRQVLINSEYNTIALHKEMETLQLYIELEQRRFKNRFDFEIKYDDGFDAQEDITVPTMLIQPFVENAIWHGIMNLDESIKGKLILSFRLTENVLKITIEDNGVGRKEAALRKVNNEYESVGIMFTQKRLELLKVVTKQQTQINVIDLIDTNGKAGGTKVELIMELIA
jgi:tetratricopeptide (TPR) repeat protein